MIEPTDEMANAGWDALPVSVRESGEIDLDDMKTVLAAVLAIVERDYERPLRAGLIELHGVLVDMVDPDPCSFDHHGHCQAHRWTEVTPRCPHARAKDALS